MLSSVFVDRPGLASVSGFLLFSFFLGSVRADEVVE